MPFPFTPIPTTNPFWLINAHIPLPLIVQPTPDLSQQQNQDGLVRVDLEIREGMVAQILPAGSDRPATIAQTVAQVDLQKGIVFPCFVDLHTHLDKGHVWERSPNRAGTFDEALAQVQRDRNQFWSADDLYRRMNFALKCSYAHGTIALRTHLDALGVLPNANFERFVQLREEWRDRLTLQAVCLVSLDYYLNPESTALADRMAEIGGILGGVAYMNEAIDEQLDRVFSLAIERNLNLDLHVDESGSASDMALRHIALAALRHNFTGQIVCGHCCSLAVQSPEEAEKTIHLVKQAGIGVVSLPMCNLYLQDRNQQSDLRGAIATSGNLEDCVTRGSIPGLPSYTPRWRGITLLHELKHLGVPVAVASDNCRDPFHGFGDHDGLEVFAQSVKIAHFDRPYGDWCRTVTSTPAELMGLPTVGRIGVGQSADLVLFKGRYFSELLSRRQSDRVVLRQGRAIDSTLPDYAELDDLMGIEP